MDVVRAIADPVRRQILELLHDAALPAGEIAAHFSISRPAVSRHLRVLTDTGVVDVSISGRRRIYSLRAAPLIEVSAFLNRLLAPPVPGNLLDALGTEVARARRDRRASTLERPAKETA